MRRSHGGEEEDEVSFSIWARVGVDWRERSKKEEEEEEEEEEERNPSLVGATLLQQT